MLFFDKMTSYGLANDNLLEFYYLYSILQSQQTKGLYSSFNNERIELHNRLCVMYGLTKEATKRITDRLDKSIGFDYDNNYSESELIELANKLEHKLIEIGGVRK